MLWVEWMAEALESNPDGGSHTVGCGRPEISEWEDETALGALSATLGEFKLEEPPNTTLGEFKLEVSRARLSANSSWSEPPPSATSEAPDARRPATRTSGVPR